MKLILSFYFLLSSYQFTFAAGLNCGFVRHQYIDVTGEKLPKELKNKILNNLNDGKLFVLKENPILGAKICSALHALKNIKDLPNESAKPGEEHILVKVLLEEEKKFWKLKISNFIKTNSKGLTLVSTSESFTSSKTINDIKDVEVVDWIIGKLVQPIKK
jgi:hypothetical protein